MPFLNNNQLLTFCLIGGSPIDSIYGFDNCPNSGKFSCLIPDYEYYRHNGYPYGYYSSCQDINTICNGLQDCDSGLDEKNCDKNVNLKKKFTYITAFSLFAVM
jgi:hypothetical protein